jgi:hypothetical protein
MRGEINKTRKDLFSLVRSPARPTFSSIETRFPDNKIKTKSRGWFIEHKTKSKYDNVLRFSTFPQKYQNFPLFSKSLQFGDFLSNMTKNSGNCLFFLLYKCHNKKSLFIQSGRPQLSSIRQKSWNFPLFGESLKHCLI